jgi:hypothetical protein
MIGSDSRKNHNRGKITPKTIIVKSMGVIVPIVLDRDRCKDYKNRSARDFRDSSANGSYCGSMSGVLG